MFRFDGDRAWGVSAIGASAILLVCVALGLEDGGWFSASEDCGDGDGDTGVCFAIVAVVTALGGVAGARSLSTIGDDGSSKISSSSASSTIGTGAGSCSGAYCGGD